MDYEKHILDFTSQLGFKNLKESGTQKLKGIKPDGIVIIGMGGSGLPGNLLLGLKEKYGLKIPILLWKNFGLPKTNFKNPLFIFISFSGNTAETLSGLKILTRRKEKTSIAAIATGGILKNIALKRNLPLVYFNSSSPAGGLTPREGIGYTYYSLIKVLKIVFPFIKVLDLSRQIKPKSFQVQAKKLARLICNKIPLIYTSSDYDYLGYVWKIILNETGKLPSFSNVIPEMCHNEIDGFQKQNFPFFSLFLTDSEMSLATKKKIEATVKILRKNGVKTLNLSLAGKNKEEKAWNSIILAHLTGFYISKIRKINPSKTVLIDELKNS